MVSLSGLICCVKVLALLVRMDLSLFENKRFKLRCILAALHPRKRCQVCLFLQIGPLTLCRIGGFQSTHPLLKLSAIR